MELISREYTIHYRYCVGSLNYILSKIVDLCFAVRKLEKFSSNPDEVHFESLVHLLRYIRDNKKLGLRYYSNIEDTPLSELLIQASINNYNQLIVLSYSNWQYFTDTGTSTGAYIVCL